MSMIRGDFRPPPMKYIKGLRDLFKGHIMPDEDKTKLMEMTEEDVERMRTQVNRHEIAYNILASHLLGIISKQGSTSTIPSETIPTVLVLDALFKAQRELT